MREPLGRIIFSFPSTHGGLRQKTQGLHWRIGFKPPAHPSFLNCADLNDPEGRLVFGKCVEVSRECDDVLPPFRVLNLEFLNFSL
jgi:hypothetical protein